MTPVGAIANTKLIRICLGLPGARLSALGLLFKFFAHPVETLVDPGTSQRAGTLTEPIPASQVLQVKSVDDFGDRHHTQVLLVGKNKQYSILEVFLL